MLHKYANDMRQILYLLFSLVLLAITKLSAIEYQIKFNYPPTSDTPDLYVTVKPNDCGLEFLCQTDTVQYCWIKPKYILLHNDTSYPLKSLENNTNGSSPYSVAMRFYPNRIIKGLVCEGSSLPVHGLITTVSAD